jgi:hypothetical protein
MRTQPGMESIYANRPWKFISTAVCAVKGRTKMSQMTKDEIDLADGKMVFDDFVKTQPDGLEWMRKALTMFDAGFASIDFFIDRTKSEAIKANKPMSPEAVRLFRCMYRYLQEKRPVDPWIDDDMAIGKADFEWHLSQPRGVESMRRLITAFDNGYTDDFLVNRLNSKLEKSGLKKMSAEQEHRLRLMHKYARAKRPVEPWTLKDQAEKN